MADLSPRDRLQPFLLDRLTDELPESGVESRDRRVYSPKQIQQSIIRDMGWLLNAKAHPEQDGLGEFPEVAKSVLNYGIPEFSGQSIASVNPGMIERTVLEALQNYEPRMVGHTLRVRMLTEAETRNPNVIAFEITGEISANQTPDALYIKTEVDLETGQFVVRDRPNG